MTTATHVCLLTAKGRSAVAVIAVRGPAAVELVDHHFHAASGLPLSELPLSRIAYGDWHGEDLIVCRLAHDQLEVHCHGGLQSPERIVDTLIAAGAKQVQWEEWLLSETKSVLQREAELALAHAKTQRTAEILLTQYHGSLEREITEIRTSLSAETRGSVSAEDRIGRLLDRAEFGLHLTRPWQVVIAGEPNVGKSSLINVLLGFERAIVFDQPGTTRDVVSATTALDGWPVELLDTAGMHTTDDPLESAGIQLARERAGEADLILWLLDATSPNLAGKFTAQEIATQQAEALGLTIDSARLLVVVNKIDLAPSPSDLADGVRYISATKGDGIAELIDAAATRLVPEVPDDGTAIPFTERQIALLKQAIKHFQSSDVAGVRASLDRLSPPVD